MKKICIPDGLPIIGKGGQAIVFKGFIITENVDPKSSKKRKMEESVSVREFHLLSEGNQNRQEVAVKRIQLQHAIDNREEIALWKLNHKNVVKLFHVQEDDTFR